VFSIVGIINLVNFGRFGARTLNTKPEVVLRHRGCHLEIAYYVITLSLMARLAKERF